MELLTYLVPIMAMIFVSFVCAIAGRHGFSLNIFLICLSICIPIFIWKGIFPSYMIVVSVLSIGVVLFSDRGGTNE